MKCWAIVLGVVLVSHSVAAKESVTLVHHPAVKSTSWKKSESPHFILHSASDEAQRGAVLLICEAQREELIGKWFETAPKAWDEKCHVVLHRTKSSYQQAVGHAVAGTRGSTWVQFDKRQPGKIAVRRIDLLCDRAADDLTALPHELTHALLADWFAGQQPPRWLDEGMALLADPEAKQKLHERDLRNAYYHRTSYRVVELLAIAEHPPQARIPAFYGQSLALVQLLIERDKPEKLLKFVARAQTTGNDQALREIYQIDGVAELERLWRTHYATLAKAD